VTITLVPDKHHLDGRSYKDRIGKPFYGPALRAVIEAPEPKPSLIDRWFSWWMDLSVREIVAIGIIGLVGLAGVVWIVTR